MSDRTQLDAHNNKSRNMPREAITLEMTPDVLSENDPEMNVNEIVSKFKLSHSAVNSAVVGKGNCMREVKRAEPVQSAVMRKHDQLMLEVEKLWIVWTDEQNETSCCAVMGILRHEITVCDFAPLFYYFFFFTWFAL